MCDDVDRYVGCNNRVLREEADLAVELEGVQRVHGAGCQLAADAHVLEAAVGAVDRKEGNACVVGLGDFSNALVEFAALADVLVECSNADVGFAVSAEDNLPRF